MHGEWGPGRPRRGGPLAAIASVAFHLTEGQQMKAVYPADSLDKDELLAVAHHSFPVSTPSLLVTRSHFGETFHPHATPLLLARPCAGLHVL